MTTLPEELDRAFRETAAASGLVDVAYDLVDSPIGELLVAVTAQGLCRISFDGQHDGDVELVSRAFGARVLRVPRLVDPIKRQLDEYFDGRRRSFEIETDLRPMPEFNRAVLARLARVPFGRLTTYGALAAQVGKPRAARAVGGVMNRNPVPIVLPCHRVVGSTGNLTGYAGGLEVKRRLLELEGALLG